MDDASIRATRSRNSISTLIRVPGGGPSKFPPSLVPFAPVCLSGAMSVFEYSFGTYGKLLVDF